MPFFTPVNFQIQRGVMNGADLRDQLRQQIAISSPEVFNGRDIVVKNDNYAGYNVIAGTGLAWLCVMPTSTGMEARIRPSVHAKSFLPLLDDQDQELTQRIGEAAVSVANHQTGKWAWQILSEQLQSKAVEAICGGEKSACSEYEDKFGIRPELMMAHPGSVEIALEFIEYYQASPLDALSMYESDCAALREFMSNTASVLGFSVQVEEGGLLRRLERPKAVETPFLEAAAVPRSPSPVSEPNYGPAF